VLGISFWTTAETLLRRAPIQLNFHSFTAHDSWETGLEDVHVVERKISLVHSCTGTAKPSSTVSGSWLVIRIAYW